MWRPPAEAVLVARAALAKVPTEEMTVTTYGAASRLAANDTHTIADIKALKMLLDEYTLNPSRVALCGGYPGALWVGECLRAAANPRDVDFTALSSRLNAIDESLYNELTAVANVAIERTLERLGRLIKANAKEVIRNNHSSKIEAALASDHREIKTALPFAIRALLTLDEEAQVRRMLSEDLIAEVRRIATDRNSQALREIAIQLGVSIDDLISLINTPFETRLTSGVEMMVTAMTASVVSRVNNADEISRDGSGNVLRTAVAAGLISDVIAALAGAATTPAGGILRVDGVPVDQAGKPLRSEGLATAGDKIEAMERVFDNDADPTRFVTEYVWRYRNPDPSNGRAAHQALNGVRWRTPQERFERIGKNSTAQNGCHCAIETMLIPLTEAA